MIYKINGTEYKVGLHGYTYYYDYTAQDWIKSNKTLKEIEKEYKSKHNHTF